MGLFDAFKRKTPVNKESNTLFGQTSLGNNVLRNANSPQSVASAQLLYVTTSAQNEAGRIIDMSMLSRNSTVMSCIGVKARALAQLPIKITSVAADGTKRDAISHPDVPAREKFKAKQVLRLLQNPNKFQSQYEFWYQFCMWYDLAGENFTLMWRGDSGKEVSTVTPLEMYLLDSTLITSQITETRYPTYRLSTPSYGFSKEEPLKYFQVVHCMDAPWQGSASFNKGTLAVELVSLDHDLDVYANFVMLNGAKPSGVFVTEQVIPDTRYAQIAARLKEAWASMTGSRATDPSKPGQSMLLDQGMKYMPVDMLTLQDADAAKLKEQTMKRICGLFGVPPAMIGVSEGKYNNTQTMFDEFYKSTMLPIIINIQQKFKANLLEGYPSLDIEFDIKDFLKGAPLDQMNYVVSGVSNGVLTPNEGREYLGLDNLDGADELKDSGKPADQIAGSSPQDTGGGGNTNSVGKTGARGSA